MIFKHQLIPPGLGLPKLLRVMKLAAFLLFTVCITASAKSFSQKITLSVKEAPLEKVFKEIKKQSEYVFFYDEAWLKQAKKVSLNVDNTALEEVLNICFANQPLTFSIIGTTVVVKQKPIAQFKISSTDIELPPPPFTVTGKITDVDGAPLAGVSVVMKSSKKGVSSDKLGVFSIQVPQEGDILVFSYIGYENSELKVVKPGSINIVLKPKDNKVEEIVVGYGTVRKKDVTGSIVSVNEKALREVPAANLQQALQGRAAGLEVQRVGTKPGAGAVIRIRGERSINGSNDPLIVLDGIPYEGGNLNDINPDDVASVDILKDASATAIYGSRGSNGVILISTKRGKQGAAKLSYNGYYGVSSARTKYNIFNAQEYTALRDLAGINPYMAEEINSRNKGLTTNWQDLMYQNANVTDQNLSVSGGSSGSNYSLGGGYYKETTVLPGQDFERFSLRSTIDSKVGNRLKIGFNTLTTLQITNGAQFNDPMFPLLTLSPLMPAYDSTGTLIVSPTGNTTDRVSQYNPLLLKNNNNSWVDKITRFRSFNSIYGEYQVMKDLKYRLNVGLDYRRQENDQFRKSDSKLAPSYFRPLKGNTASVNNAEGLGYTLENILTYDKTFKGKHKINITGLYSFQQDRSHNTFVSKDSIDENFIQFYNLGQASASNSTKPITNGSESTFALESYMLRMNYVFSDKYMLTLTERIDGSSRLAPGNKYHEYPALSAGWNISNEKFMQRFQQISNLKLRAGIGQTSNQSVSPYGSLGLFSQSNFIGGNGGNIRYNFGPSTIVTGYNMVTLPNPNLDWEYTKTINAGVDFGLLDNRITGSIDWYNAHTFKILYGIALPPTSGIVGSFTTNIGEMENKGIEISLSSKNIMTNGGFTWSTDFNIFANRNKLLKLTDGFTKNIASQLFLNEPLSAIYDYNKLGIWQISEAADAAKFGNLPGDIKLEDLNGDGKIDPNNDRKVIGSSQAKWQGGMTNRFTYKNFDCSFVLYGRFGGLLVSQVHQPTAAYVTVLDGLRNTMKVDYWTPSNPTNAYPSPTSLNRSRPVGTDWTTLGYYDASFIKLRSINFGYSLSSKLLNSLKVQSFRLYVAAQNPFVLYSPYMKIGGVDPEATGTGNQGIQNPGNLSSRALTLSLSTPPTRALLIGLNLNF